MTIESNVGAQDPRIPRAVRLLLTFLGVLFGLLLLGFVFGSSPASADEAPDAGGALIGTLDSAAHAAPVSSIAAPIVDHVDAVVADAVPAAPPVAPLLQPVTTIVDTTVAVVSDTVVVPALDAIEGLARAVPAVPVAATAASAPLPALPALAAGSAQGAVDLLLSDPLGAASVDAPAGGAAPFVAALGAGLVALLIARRRRLPDGAVPASVVYDTDSSPD